MMIEILLYCVIVCGIFFAMNTNGQATPAPVSPTCHDALIVGIGSLGSDCVFDIESSILTNIEDSYLLACTDLINDPFCTNYETANGQPVWHSVNNDGTGCVSGTGTFYAIIIEMNGILEISAQYVDSSNTCKTATFELDADPDDLFEFNPVGCWVIDGTSDDCGFADVDGNCDACAPDASMDFDDCDGFGVSDTDFPMNPTPQPTGSCETAFGILTPAESLCFLDDPSQSFNANRWGWVTSCNGNCGDGTTFDMWAGAADCDIITPKGTFAGTVELKDIGGGLVEAIFTSDPGCTFETIHIWVDDAQYPTLPSGSATVAPGKFNFNDDASGTSPYAVTINTSDDDDGIFSIIIHAVACC